MPRLDAAQEAAVGAVFEAPAPGRDARGHRLIVGEAGSGKSTVAAAIAVHAARTGVSPDTLVVVAPTREAAARLGDRISLLIDAPVGTPVVRTMASIAHGILSARAHARGEAPPRLVTGAEQDQLLREMLDGHARGEGKVPDWAGVVPPQATLLPGFRAELRDLLMRAAEAGLTPAALARLGDATDRPEWRGAATVLDEYESLLTFLSSTADQGERLDPATVVARASTALAGWEDGAPGAPWSLVIVDDAHDLTAAGGRLLEVMAARGARIVLLGNADQCVQGYRGARPELLAGATLPQGLAAAVSHLGPSHRQGGLLAAVTAAAASHVGVQGVGSARRPADGGVESGVVPNAEGMGADAVETVADAVAPVIDIVAAAHRHAHSRAIAVALREARHGLAGEPVAWGSMAVIARSAARLREIRGDLAAADIPCETLGEGTALHREGAVAPMLAIVVHAAALVAGDAEPWPEQGAIEVLGSRLVGLDPVAMRRLRRALVKVERDNGGTRGSSDLLAAAMDDASMWAAIGSAEARLAERATKAQEAAQREIRAGASPGRVVWAVWETMGVAQRWREAALEGSARDDADLDAVIALLKAAELYAERLPRASVTSFIEHLEGQEFAADSLGARGRSADAVTFCTPAGAAGREWDLVVVAGLEEGVWPDLRLRDTVLGAQHLADVVAGRAPAAPVAPAARAAASREARRAVLDDESRSFVVAVSRARSRLVLACVDGDDERPSRFISWASAAAAVPLRRADSGARVADLRTAVAAVRAAAAGAESPAREAHVEVLARLAGRRVAGAHPVQWHGVTVPSTETGIWADDQEVRVSPSKIEALERCPLRWALESVGGTTPANDKQSLGTLVHDIAATMPAGSRTELLAELDRRWTEVSNGATDPDAWPERVRRANAQLMIERLASYFLSKPGVEVRVEERFTVGIGRAVLSGSADRIEVTSAGARVIDLKTGGPITQAEAATNPQLEMYQLAASEGGFAGIDRTIGAALIYLGGTTAGASAREQSAVDPASAHARLAQAVDVMTAATMTAIINDKCSHCPVKRSCPAQLQGRQVTDA